jgi:hypothetical protein
MMVAQSIRFVLCMQRVGRFMHAITLVAHHRASTCKVKVKVKVKVKARTRCLYSAASHWTYNTSTQRTLIFSSGASKHPAAAHLAQ